MPRQGADYAWFRPDDSWFAANGITFVSRYLSWLPNGKVLTKAEYDHLRSIGVDVCFNWEFGQHDEDRAFQGGVTDASEAYRQVKALGVPEPFVIYFSADWDATEAEFNAHIKPYLQGAGSVLGGADYVGSYGSYYTVKRAFDAGVIKYGWQTYAWSGGQWDNRAQVRQVRNGLGNGQWDLDYAYTADFGQAGAQTVVPDPPAPLALSEDAVDTFLLGGVQYIAHVNDQGQLEFAYLGSGAPWKRYLVGSGLKPGSPVRALTFGKDAAGRDIQRVYAITSDGHTAEAWYEYDKGWNFGLVG